ncbi:MAG: hypothetical protein HQ478_04710 [Chloroflexi bacterium]|nr:hypothetical protein [Chloroflexota bacterium]
MGNNPVTVKPTSQDGEFDRDLMLRGLWDSLHELRDTVENDHDHRLRRIEADLRWLTLLLGAEIVALISASIATIAGSN